MKFAIGSRFALYISLILIISITLFLTLYSIKSWLAYVYVGESPPEGLKRAIAIESENAQIYFLLAQYYDNNVVSMSRNQIYNLCKKSLELNPLDYNFWYYLADFLTREGKKDLAIFTLNHATELAPGVVSLRWAGGMLASRLGDEEALTSNMRSVLANDPHRRKKVFIVLWQSLRNGNKILNAIPENAYIEYIHFLIDTHRFNEIRIVWNKLHNKSEIPRDLFLRYVNFLINNNEFDIARSVWIDRFGDWEGVWNGHFENDILNGGFDWRLYNVKGVKIKRERMENNKYAIKMEFDGKENIDFHHLRQLIPVEDNTDYILTSIVKTKELTTHKGLYWQVYCLNNKSVYAETNEFKGTTELHSVSVRFRTPSGCDAVILSLRRDGKNIIGRKISGTAWIEQVAIEKLY